MGKKNAIQSAWRRIQLVDKFLIIIMVILILFATSTLFIGSANSEVTSGIDIVVRTTIASVFGYFISSNFVKNEQNFTKDLTMASGLAPLQQEVLRTDTDAVVNKIGFNQGDGTDAGLKIGSLQAVEVATKSKNGVAESKNNSLQVTIIGVLCLCSIAIILGVRYFAGSDSAEISTISQFRDIVGGCIGFLIGTPTDQQEEA